MSAKDFENHLMLFMLTKKKNALRILLVDDDIDLLMLMERKLQQNGYIVETAASLPEAEYILSLFKPNLVLIDINIAGDDGRRLCWKIKHKDCEHTPKVILMSGRYYPTSRILFFGADEFIAKPFVSEFVLQKIAKLLHQEQPVPVTEPIQSCIEE